MQIDKYVQENAQLAIPKPLAFILTLYEYKMLSEDKQYDTVFAKGKFLDIVIGLNLF